MDIILPTKATFKNARASVSAEAFGNFNKKVDFVARVIPKSDQTKEVI